ncbi:MAG TPA: beta-propeller fold lactonase family protein [Jatrophihabitans sp.]|nr:beta-propeller fold lactonase family protein [Jatrophihabitans sp.]
MIDFQLLLVGTYTAPMGQAQGISLIAHDRRASTLVDLGLVAVTESPSYLAGRDGAVYAVNEADHGRITGFEWLPAERRLVRRSVQATGGAHPCHVAVHGSGRLLAVANYTSGSVALHPCEAGSIGPFADLVELRGHGPVTDRQGSAHAHQVVFADDLLYVVDLGSDRVWRFVVEPAGATTTSIEPLVLPPGFGPRQLLLDSGAGPVRFGYVLGELSGQIAVFDLARGGGPVAMVATSEKPLPDGNLAAGLIAGGSPGECFVSHRGANVIVRLAGRGAGLAVTGEVSSGGSWPRFVGYLDDYLYVANQESGTVACLAPNQPGAAALTVAVPSPACVLPMG